MQSHSWNLHPRTVRYLLPLLWIHSVFKSHASHPFLMINVAHLEETDCFKNKMMTALYRRHFIYLREIQIIQSKPLVSCGGFISLFSPLEEAILPCHCLGNVMRSHSACQYSQPFGWFSQTFSPPWKELRQLLLMGLHFSVKKWLERY